MSHNPQYSIDGIRAFFKLKNDKVKKPGMYLGPQIKEVSVEAGTLYWTMSSVKYLKDAIANVEDNL